ncbi:MAG: amino acid permease [Acidobacteriota bacterium]|nr:amino acid permease [Acidobacteriota bacterium]
MRKETGAASPSPAQPSRMLTLPGLTLVAVGSCIGAGIFFTPSMIAGYLSSPLLILAAWGLGAVVSLTGALTFAELGSMFTGAGGQYAYLRETYGPVVGFLFGWITFTVVNAAAIASLSIVFARYFAYLFALPFSSTTVIALAAIASVCVVNVLRAKLSEIFAGFFTGLKLFGMGAVTVIGLTLGTHGKTLAWTAPNVSLVDPTLSPLAAFALAFVGVWYSSGGWQHASYLAGEARNPARTVPRAMVAGALIVGTVYILINLAYLSLMPIADIAASQSVAAEAMSRAGPWGGTLIAATIAVSTFGTVGICLFSAPRIFFAMAADGVFFKGLARIHPRFKTPARAILLQASWAAILLLFWGTFADIATYLVFADTVFITITAFAVIRLRKTMPDRPRPYRTLAYPVTPLVFILISGGFGLNLLINRPLHSLASLGLAALGLLIYRCLASKNP